MDNYKKRCPIDGGTCGQGGTCFVCENEALGSRLKAAEARIAELESYNVGLATESHRQQGRISELEKALDQLHDAASDFSADQSIAADPRCAVTQPVTVEEANALNAALSVAAALLKEKE